MAEIFDFYVNDNRAITFKLTEPIMLEDNGVSDWRFHIPNTVNGLDVTGWQWWLVYVNARNEKYTVPLTLEYDYDRPDAYSIATYTVDYGMSCKVGNIKFSIEAIDADTGGTILHEWHTKTYGAKVEDTLQGNQIEYDETESDLISALLIEVRNRTNQLIGGATPTPVSAVSEMLDTDKLYLLTTDGEWYYYNGTAWVSGGVYGAGIVDSAPTQGSTNAVSSGGVYEALHNTDTTLSQSGQAADAKSVGDGIGAFSPLLDKTNIFKFSISGFVENGITCSISKNHVKLNGTSTGGITKNNIFAINGIKPNTTYSVRIFNAVNVSNNEAFYIFDGSTTLATIPCGAGGRNGVTFTTGESVENISTRFYIGTDQSFNDASFDIMAVEGEVPTEYIEPNKLIAATKDDLTGFDVTKHLSNDFWINGSANRLNYNVGQMPCDGVLTVNSIPANYHIGIQGHDSILYNNRISDTGWKLPSHVPFSVNCSASLYYVITLRRSDNGTIRDITPVDDIDITYTAKTNNVSFKLAFEDTKIINTPQSMRIIAHRGDDILAPQNTAPAYIVARKQGFMIAENDVYGKIDNEYVMWHDPTLVRLYQMVDVLGYLMYTDGDTIFYLDPETESLYTYNNGYVASTVDVSTLTRCVGSNYTCESFDFDTLRRIDVGANKGQQFAGTQIMTFKEWVLLCKKLGMELYIDHKMTYTNADILALFEIVKAAGMTEHASWIGLNVATATYLRTLDPDARIGILENPTQELITTYTPLNTNHNLFFNGNAKEMTREAVQLGINAGFDVEAWMVDFLAMSESVVIDTINNVIDYGISGLTTDHYTLEKIYPELY